MTTGSWPSTSNGTLKKKTGKKKAELLQSYHIIAKLKPGEEEEEEKETQKLKQQHLQTKTTNGDGIFSSFFFIFFFLILILCFTFRRSLYGSVRQASHVLSAF
ncbi:hypothetical protein TYRP_020663 [Tyrophagus putrescentiae]|nr:hypothetical protein TYRP_020663 [Tyrophagus putrescentiae]